jgi:hypothetical protein
MAIYYCNSAYLYTVVNGAVNSSDYIQSDSVARDPKLLSIRNYVIEIMT